jgi:hypothetical protein
VTWFRLSACIGVASALVGAGVALAVLSDDETASGTISAAGFFPSPSPSPTPRHMVQPSYAGVDLDPAGNSCGNIGTVESATGMPVNTPTVIDVVVFGVPDGPSGIEDGGGIFGTGFEFKWSPAASLRVTNAFGGSGEVLHLCSGTGYLPLEVFDTVPDTDGSFRVDTVDLSGNEESGSGRLASITVECLGTGTVTVDLTDTSIGGGQKVGITGDSGNFTYNPQNAANADGGTIFCGSLGTPTPDPPGTPTPTPGPGERVVYAGVDLINDDNECNSLGETDRVRGGIALNNPFSIDVVVKDVPVGSGGADGGGLYGTGFEMLYDNSRLRIIEAAGGDGEVLHLCPSGTPFVVMDSLPDSDGEFRFDSVDLSTTEESGDGRLATITLECIAEGDANIDFTDTSTGGNDTIGVLADTGSRVYAVLEEGTGVIGCGTSVETATPTPVVTQAATPTPTATPTTTAPTASPTRAPTESPLQSLSATPAPSRLPTPTVTPTPTPTPLPTPTPTVDEASSTPVATPGPSAAVVPADYDCSGHVDQADALALLLMLAGLESSNCLEAATYLRGDVNCDGHVDVRDVLRLLRLIAGIEAMPEDC